MKNRIFLVALFIPITTLLWAKNEVNLLVNGGLEEWMLLTDNILKGWFCHNNGNVKREFKITCEGKTSAKMQSQEKGSTARVDQRIAVSPGQKLRIRFCYYIEQWKSQGARVYCYFRTDAAEQYNIPADDLRSFFGKDKYYSIRGGGYGRTYLPYTPNLWQVFDETVEVPPTAHYFVFGVNSYYGTTIYVDNCWVTDVTETTIIGDVNGNGGIDIGDAVSIVNYLVNKPTETFIEQAADTNKNGKIDIGDAVTIMNLLVGKTTSLTD